MHINESDLLLKFLPHDRPLRLIDRCLEISEVGIKCIKNISINEDIFNGHFPQTPIFPGVYTIEALSQASGLLQVYRLFLEKGFIKGPEFDISPSYAPKNIENYIVKIDNAKFKKKIVPGDQLILEAKFIKNKGPFIYFSTVAKVENNVVCDLDLTLFFEVHY